MSPPASPTSSPKADGKQSPLSIDLTSLPPLVQPSPPSNTLLVTNLNNPSLFQAPSLDKIRALLSSQNPLNSFAPIRSFHRIIISYSNIDAAIQTRQLLDGVSTKFLLPQNPDTSQEDETTTKPSNGTHFDRIRCYFGEPTPVAGEDQPDQHLKAPNPGKLFFISPPPSPPCGWEIREEDPPNKDTHAADLERALAGVGGNDVTHYDNNGNVEHAGADEAQAAREERLQEGTPGDESEDVEGWKSGVQGRTQSMTVYHPKDHGSKESLPAVVVSDTSAGEEDDGDGEGVASRGGKVTLTHTSRPPVELMEE